LPSRGGTPAFSPGLALALAVIAISCGSILVRLCSGGPLSIAFYRMALAAVLLAPFAFRRGMPGSFSRGTWARVLLAGLFLAIHFGAWIWSLGLTSVGSSVVLVSTQPLFSGLISGAVLGERASAKFYGGISLCLAGTLWISGADWGLSRERLVGDLLSLVAACAAAACFVVGRSVRSEVPFLPYLFLLHAGAAVFLGGAALATGQALTGFPARDAVWLVAMAIVPSLVGHGCLNWAVRHLRVFIVNLATFGEPVLATLYARALFREPISHSLLAGSCLIAAGVVISLLPGSSLPREAP